MSALASPAFAAALRAERDVYNQKFAEARRRRPDLDARAFAEFLREPAAAVVESATRVAPGAASAVAHAVYDAALVLVSERLAGPAGRHAVIGEAWRRLLPLVPGLVADQPVRVIASLTNAVLKLAVTPGARPREWLDRMASVAAQLPSVGDLLTAGQVAGWRAGLAHLGEGALAAADRLPPQLPPLLLGAPKLEWQALRDRLLQDPWWDPAAPLHAARPRGVATVGAFRGFGGLFVEPPRAVAVDGRLYLAAAGECWQLCADAFGATFHRAEPASIARPSPNPQLELGPDRVSFAGHRLGLPPIGRVTSAAIAGSTLAVTGHLTHSVALYAL
jgi:hypothetical protein